MVHLVDVTCHIILFTDGAVQVYGAGRQDQFPGKYSGNQCTSMATAAGIMWLTGGDWTSKHDITPDLVNSILVNGNKLHYCLR